MRNFKLTAKQLTIICDLLTMLGMAIVALLDSLFLSMLLLIWFMLSENNNDLNLAFYALSKINIENIFYFFKISILVFYMIIYPFKILTWKRK
ncbi:hypothetical protein [Arcobacter sp. F2176]|uniref:hypothetical protein n=1 Tax=Arcobacter sp. F2176 TaxID=2044511 RepID=UPI00100C0E36|nr:hypothetical protein [Arcobacter sp. F2176]RXJ82184.1 hypothetical protein CRU95_04665 [Arcobacter sp. F2176]